MATILWLTLLLWLSYLIFRDGRRAFGGRRSGNPVLRRLDREVDPVQLDLERLRRDMDAACGVDEPSDDAPPGTLAEARETTLTHQLLTGAIDPPDYRWLMGELARSSTDAGDPR